MQERILVTGGTGFTGSHLCKRLIERGYSVRALVRDKSRGDDLARWGVELVVGDLRNRRSLAKATQGIDTVYHIAASFRPENISRRDLWEINVEGTRNLLEVSIAADVGRFVHCSTVGVHGNIKNPPASEETPYQPEDSYQASKAEGERVVLQHAIKSGPDIVVFRPAGIYGPGDVRFLKLFKAIKKRRFVMLGSGQVLYQLIYIDDLIEGILLCGTKEEAVGQVFILTGQAPITLNCLVQEIANTVHVQVPRGHFPVMPVYLAGFACELFFKPLGIQPPIYRRRVDFFRKDRAFSIEKAKNKLGFQPKVELKFGLQKTTAWYKEQGLL